MLSLATLKTFIFGPTARWALLGGLVLWLVYSVYSDITSAYYKVGRLEANEVHDALSDEVKDTADKKAAEVEAAVDKARALNFERLSGLEETTIQLVRSVPDLNTNNPGCRVPETLINEINKVK